MSRRRSGLFGLVALLCIGPAIAVAQEDELDPLRRITPEEARHTPGIFDVYDPWERANRRVYVFNARFDDYVFLPYVRGYEFVLPQIVRTGIANFFRNIADVLTFANSVLQLKGHKASGSLGRVVINTTIGVAGLWDPATRIGIPRSNEDFGQTLGRYGVPAGPYLVVPVMGPSSLRDFPGTLVDRIPGILLNFPPWQATPVETADTRANTPFRYGEIGAPFEYTLVRFLAMERRRLMVAD